MHINIVIKYLQKYNHLITRKVIILSFWVYCRNEKINIGKD